MTDEPTLAQFEEATLTLENDRIFYDAFMKLYEFDKDACLVRLFINENLLRLRLPTGKPSYREALRLYFEDRYDLPTKTSSTMRPYPGLFEKAPEPTTTEVATVATVQDSPATAPCSKQTQPQPFPEYKAMNTSILTLTTKHYINGTNIASLSNSQIYNLIAQQEAAIKDLEAIANKPNSLTKEIADRKASIQTLVDFLNDRDAKAQA